MLRIADPYELRLARELVFDEYQRLLPRPNRKVPVQIVDIDEASLAKIGQWPWPRSELARLVERLHDLGASAIAFDMVFPEADRLSPSRLVQESDLKVAIGADLAERIASRVPDYDQLFAAAVAGKPVVLGFAAIPGSDERRPAIKTGLAFTGEDPRPALPSFTSGTLNLREFDGVARGIGAITLSPLDTQGVVRRIPLLWTDGRRIYPSLVVEVLRVMQGETSVLVHSRDTAPFAVTGVRVGRFDLPTTSAGELRIRFGHDTPARRISAEALLYRADSDGLRELIAGHAVLIGTSAVGLYDYRVTPLGETVPGVTVHAQALEQILAGDHLRRPDWGDPLEWAWMLLLGAATTIVAATCSPGTALAYGGTLAAVTFLGAWIAFSQGGILLDPTYPCAAGLFLYVAMISFRYFVSDRDRRFVRQAFARYVAPSYLEHIEKDPASLRLGGDEREMTILFLDIRDFTSLSERLSPTEVVEFLNVLLGHLSRDVLTEGGTIDKYIGDSIMAFWNAPIQVPDHAARACRAALRIRNTLHELNESDAFRFRQRTNPLPDVAIGIGINTGPALVGNMGSDVRFNYSVVGDTVNVASRVEGQAKPLCVDIVVADTVKASAHEFAYLKAGRLALRGKSHKVKLFILAGDGGTASSPEYIELKHHHAELLASVEKSVANAAALSACNALADRCFPWLYGFYRGGVRHIAVDRAKPRLAREPL
ncbi:CHASE2 domain-containing protein [Microvirga puerhi]|uniref:Adenylate/guanylate cyclase domain-containing protein n=1 Tax=Microvirga puerhi TaxID=2876078 RepID=A0ABS7VJV0_9HYPH|nr:adenylate/guanylate cyclase domain-containing protein [Microvirga puerhi]MBZ6075312.1 adenylate/guanylate cyclase domain-containing protein [Microvirga puerhi]